MNGVGRQKRHKLFCAALGLGLALQLAAMPVDAQSAPLPPGTSEEAVPVPGQALDEPLAAAEAKLDGRDYTTARSMLNRYLSVHPSDARALFDLGYIEDAEDHAQAAEGDYRKAIASDAQQFESRLALGLLLIGANPAEARVQLEAATHLQPSPANPAAKAQADRAFARLVYATEPEVARQALLAALKLSPETPADTLLTAEIAEAADDPATAEEAYRRVLTTASATTDADTTLTATIGLAHLLIAAQRYGEAESLLRKALAQNAANPVLNSQLANALMAENKASEAIAVLEKLHAAQNNDRNVARLLAELYTQAGDPAKADSLYVQLLAGQGAPDAALLAARGDNLVRQQRFADAVVILKQATELDAQNGNAWSSLAFAASESHQPQLTLDSLAMRSKVMPETPATYFLSATAWDTLHQTKRAVDMYKQFLAVAGGKFPDEEWQAKHRLTALSR